MSVEIDLACGLYININKDTENEIVKSLMTSSKRTVEVMVSFKGITKEYTFADFFKRLGFGK